MIKILLPKEGTKKHNKHRHIANERIISYIPCQLCHIFPSSQTHEIFHNGSAYMRNLSMEYGAQVALCGRCHEELHSHPRLEDVIKANFQSKIMQEHEIDMATWIEKFGKNYL